MERFDKMDESCRGLLGGGSGSGPINILADYRKCGHESECVTACLGAASASLYFI